MKVLGIDVGASGVKGAPVETRTGKLLTPRYRLSTPDPATPEAVAAVVGRIARHFEWKGPVGCTVPAVVRDGKTCTASNISAKWLGANAIQLFREATKCRVAVINDADAAGWAEMRVGAGRSVSGLVIVLTLGTGIGTALFIDGHLVPNTELGQLKMSGKRAEKLVAASVRTAKKLSWKHWARRLDCYLIMLHGYFWPVLFVIGGGISRKKAHFMRRLTVPVKVAAARLRNEAGIVGAALAYEHCQRTGRKRSRP